ncbi:MAG: SGNH/GDSL hydrolase family protein [Sedimentisphaerales bacterium]
MKGFQKEFISSEIGDRQLLYRDIRNHESFVISGFAWYPDQQEFYRLPKVVLPQMSEGVRWETQYSTAGGMVRFKTNSDTIAIWAEFPSNPDVHLHMPRTGSSGFDIYFGQGTAKRYAGAENQIAAAQGSTELKVIGKENLSDTMRECTINFPLYNGVKNLFIGLRPESRIEKPSRFTIEKPLLFYGSSITQGGCASRPGNSHCNIIARWLDANLLNFGFNGSAKGEPAVAELIASLDISVFIMEYDHNSMSVEHLDSTHETFYQIIRKTQPRLPIVIVSRPDFEWTPEFNRSMRAVVRKTYDNAKNNGDSYVFFIDGETLFGTKDSDACTVDGRHPNDLGFMRMAETMCPVIKQAIALYDDR